MPASGNIVDRSSLTQGLYKELVLDPKQTAIVTIDMHRGRLDMDMATMPAQPEDAKRVIANARAALDFARAQGLAVIHVILVYRRIPGRGSEGMVSPFWGVKNVVLMGINTNTCVLNTSFTAFNFDYRVVVLSDCVASMYGDDLHVLGLQNIARCLGWVISNRQFFEKIGGQTGSNA